MGKQAKKEKAGELAFEDALAQLEDIVRKLESGALSLDESLELFEQGQRLAALCNTRLDQAELKIQQLSSSPDGAPALSPLADDETA